ncbi:MAG: hypothetical protein EOO63_09575 [Hymenobacter sp.]|nr:MAG: hypothetical protein EOO63_09575 [Hymenobacter sp.]
MGSISLRHQLIYALLLFVMLVLLVPRGGHGGDINFWVRWATYIHEHGLGSAYQIADNDYNPFYHYILWLFGSLMGRSEKIEHYGRALKAFTLVFDFAGAFWAASLVADRSRRFGLVLLLLFNIGYLYNTVVWVQVDSIYTFFSFGAVVLAVQRRSAASLMFYVLALSSKTQAIIFLPPLLLLWLPQWWLRPSRLAWSLAAGAGLLLLVLAPFTWWSAQNYLPRIIDINLHVTNAFPRVSPSAYNLWYLLAPKDSALQNVSDQLPVAFGLTYRAWGLLLFFSSSVVALTPLLVAAWRTLRRLPGAGPAPDLALTLLSCGCIPLLFCFFNTQMHERYWHASILFLAAYGFLRRDYLPYILASVAYFLNLECVLRHLELMNYEVLVFQEQFVAAIFALAILLAVFKIYRLAPWRSLPPVAAAA